VVLSLACLVLLATATTALGRAKTCSQINNCAEAVSTPPIVTAPPPGVPPPPAHPTSRFVVDVKTAPTATLGATHESGKLVENVDLGRAITCSGYKERDTTAFEFKLLTATPLNITYVIVDRIKNTTAGGIHFCLAASFPFKTLSGQPAAATVLPDGTHGHIGLLPECAHPLPPPGATTAPCVVATTTVTDAGSTSGVDVIMRVRVPTRTKSDPWGSG
jgi:hypothetical protein